MTVIFVNRVVQRTIRFLCGLSLGATIDERVANEAGCYAADLKELVRQNAFQGLTNITPSTDLSHCEHPYLNRVYINEGEPVGDWECQHCHKFFFLLQFIYNPNVSNK